MEKNSYFAIFEKSDDGYSVYFPDVQGCVSWGANILEAQKKCKRSLRITFVRNGTRRWDFS